MLLRQHLGTFFRHLSLHLTQFQRRWWAWVSSLALVFAALSPGLAQALAAPERNGHWMEICTHTGSVWVQLDQADDGAQPGSPLGASQAACPFCLLAMGFAPGPARTATSPVPQEPVLAVAHTHLPTAVHAPWTAGAQRAPPSHFH